MTYWDRLKTLAKGFGREINHAWDEAEHPRGKTSPESTPGSFAPAHTAGEAKAGATMTSADLARHVDEGRRMINSGNTAAFRENMRMAEQLYGADYAAKIHHGVFYESPPIPTTPIPAFDPDVAPERKLPPGEAQAQANVADALKRSLAYKNPHGDKIGIGTILYRSWGYDQTNINYYQVVGMSPTGKTVKIREIAQIDRGASGPMSGKTRAVPGAWIGDRPMTRRVNMGYRGQPGVNFNSYSSLSIWNGEDQYHSWDH